MGGQNQSEKYLHELADRAAITDVIYRYGRGMDRMDRELTLSCWHPGGTDDHAPLYSGTGEGFVDWVFPVHAAMLCTRHEVTNLLIEIDGDRAGSEAYWQVVHRVKLGDEVVDIQARGRYVDTFEKIDGVWAIRHRQSIRDWSRTDSVQGRASGSQLQPIVKQNNPEVPEVLPKRDRTDYSYSVLSKH